MRTNAKVDNNHTEITTALRAIGAKVEHLSQLKNICDLLVGYNNKWFLIEVKDGVKFPKKFFKLDAVQKHGYLVSLLTEGELEFYEQCKLLNLPYAITYDINSTFKAIGAPKMIDHLQGYIHESSEDNVILRCGGIGYSVSIASNTYKEIKDLDGTLLHIYQHFREDGQTLYGFADKAERELFKLLIGAKGVGCSTVLRMFDNLSYDEIVEGLTNKDEVLFKGVKGIGKKTIENLFKYFEGKL